MEVSFVFQIAQPWCETAFCEKGLDLRYRIRRGLRIVQLSTASDLLLWDSAKMYPLRKTALLREGVRFALSHKKRSEDSTIKYSLSPIIVG